MNKRLNYMALFFVLLYGVALLKPIQPLVDYSINKDYISTVLCINKDKPEMQCNGKCHLAKELKKESEESSNSQAKINIKDYPIGFVELTMVLDKTGQFNLQNQFFYWVNHYAYGFSSFVFVPPGI